MPNKAPRNSSVYARRPTATSGPHEEGVMSMQLLKGLAPATLLALLAVGSVPVEAAEVRATIPFDFVLQGKTMPRGTYNVSDTRGVLSVWNANAHGTGAFVQTIAVQSQRDRSPRLVFHRYGDQYYLRQAWTRGGSGREIPTQRQERELARAARGGRTAARAFESVVVPAL
jgi:hypothetical protein